MAHRTSAELAAGLPHILAAPRGTGSLVTIVRRPSPGERVILRAADLDPIAGLVGDRWCIPTPEKTPDPAKQITIMSARVIELIAAGGDWAPAGDQLFVELDLSETALPVGARLAIGSALLEVTAPPHTGCKKFAARFGVAAVEWTKAPAHAHLRLRGLHARVVTAGTVQAGDAIICT